MFFLKKYTSERLAIVFKTSRQMLSKKIAKNSERPLLSACSFYCSIAENKKALILANLTLKDSRNKLFEAAQLNDKELVLINDALSTIDGLIRVIEEDSFFDTVEKIL